MNALCRALAEGLDVRVGAKVVSLEGPPGAWFVVEESGLKSGPFHRVVSTAPPVQSAALLEGWSPIAKEAAEVRMQACFALMIESETGASLPGDGIRCGDHPILGWAAVDSSKPGRAGSATAIVIQSNNTWAEAHVEDDHPGVARILREAAVEALGLHPGDRWTEMVHRWLYAKPAEPLGRPFLIDRAAGLAIAGDWCVAGKVEGAFLSGDALASAWSD